MVYTSYLFSVSPEHTTALLFMLPEIPLCDRKLLPGRQRLERKNMRPSEKSSVTQTRVFKNCILKPLIILSQGF